MLEFWRTAMYATWTIMGVLSMVLCVIFGLYYRKFFTWMLDLSKYEEEK